MSPNELHLGMSLSIDAMSAQADGVVHITELADLPFPGFETTDDVFFEIGFELRLSLSDISDAEIEAGLALLRGSL